MSYRLKESQSSSPQFFGKALSADSVLELCSRGEVRRGALVAEAGFFRDGEYHPITAIPWFEKAISEFEAKQAQEPRKKRYDAEHNPASTDLLYTQFNNKVLGPYTVAQVRGLWNRGQIPANAVFKHPDYEEWFPCLSLFKAGVDERGQVGVVPQSASLNRVVVTDFDMEFGSMVVFMVKWCLASIPAFIILFVIGFLVALVLATMSGLTFGR